MKHYKLLLGLFFVLLVVVPEQSRAGVNNTFPPNIIVGSNGRIIIDPHPLCVPMKDEHIGKHKNLFVCHSDPICQSNSPSDRNADKDLKKMTPLPTWIMEGGLFGNGHSGAPGESPNATLGSTINGVDAMVCDDGIHPCLVNPKTGAENCSTCP